MQCISNSTYLSHIGDHVECDVGESLMEVATNHTDPGERISCVGAGLIERHHMGQMGKFCVLLLQTHLREHERGQSQHTTFKLGCSYVYFSWILFR